MRVRKKCVRVCITPLTPTNDIMWISSDVTLMLRIIPTLRKLYYYGLGIKWAEHCNQGTLKFFQFFNVNGKLTLANFAHNFALS